MKIALNIEDSPGALGAAANFLQLQKIDIVYLLYAANSNGDATLVIDASGELPANFNFKIKQAITSTAPYPGVAPATAPTLIVRILGRNRPGLASDFLAAANSVVLTDRYQPGANLVLFRGEAAANKAMFTAEYRTTSMQQQLHLLHALVAFCQEVHAHLSFTKLNAEALFFELRDEVYA
jgi:hypothetical protein